jgi:hypothetical protein
MDGSSRSSEFGFEAAFEAAENHLSLLEEHLKAAGKAAAAGQKAARVGDLAALSRAIQTVRVTLRELEPGLDQAGAIVSRNYAESMRSGDFAREVVASAARQNLSGVRVVHGVVFSFPVVVVPQPDKLAVRLGKKLVRMLRPSALVAQLQSLRTRRSSGPRLAKLLDAIERAYIDAAGGRTNIAVKIQDIYERLTPLPDQKREYGELDFISDLYALERENVLLTANRRVISFPASTGTRGGNAIRLTTESGEERLYSSVRFD